MRKLQKISFLILVFFFSLILFAQDEESVEDNFVDETYQEDEIPAEQNIITELPQCQCPEPQEEVGALFPPNSVFLVTPVPEPQEQIEEAPKKNLPPGYIEKSWPGYSDESYKQIPPN